ncbi:unnamed protein product [Arctogadus glacialis]
MFLTNVASFKRGGFRLSNGVSFLAKKHCYSNENINQTQVRLLFVPSLRIFSNNITANFNLMIILTYSILDNYKDACRLLEQYQTGCNTSDLQSEAEQECGPPYKRQRKAVHHFGDSDESEDAPTSRRGPGSSSRVSPRLEENCLAPHHGAGPQQPLPKQLPAFNMRRVTQGTAVPPLLPPPPTSTLSLRPTEEPSSIPAIRPTWRGGRMNESIPCSAAEVHILNLLETIKQQQDQLAAKVNYLCSRMNSTPGPDVEMPDNINLPLELLEAVEAFEVFLKEPSNYPARQRVIASLATIGGQDLKRVTWNILGRLYTDDVSHQINWKGVNNKKAFSQMSAKSLLFSKYIIQSNIDCLAYSFTKKIIKCRGQILAQSWAKQCNCAK